MHERHRQAAEEAQRQTEVCAEWLRQIIVPNQPKMFSKDELRAEAIRRWGVSKGAFDRAWIWVIEEMGRQDWYEPLRRVRRTTKQ